MTSYSIAERTPGGDWYLVAPSGMILHRYSTKTEALKAMRRMNKKAKL